MIMVDGIYNIVVTNKTGQLERFRCGITDSEITAWNENYFLSGTVGYYNSNVHFKRSTTAQVKSFLILDYDDYSFEGFTTVHSDGFTIVQPGGLELVIVAIEKDGSVII